MASNGNTTESKYPNPNSPIKIGKWYRTQFFFRFLTAILSVVCIIWYATMQSQSASQGYPPRPVTAVLWIAMILALAIDVLFMYAVMYHEYRIGTFLWAKKPWVFFLCQTFVAVLFPVSTWLCFGNGSYGDDGYGGAMLWFVLVVVSHMHALYFFFALYDFIKNKRSNKLAEIKKQRTVGQRPDSALEIPLEDSTPSQGDGVVTTTTATTPGQSLQIPMKS